MSEQSFPERLRASRDVAHGSGSASTSDSTSSDERLMHRAIELARRGEGLVSPNPPVGAVVSRDGRIVGEGWHRAIGGAHAEVEALRSAGDLARGATVHVTLEPCDHVGRTPPCTAALIEAGVARVVYAVADPNPLACGGGRALERAGIEVVAGVAERSARVVARAFLHHVEHARPWVIAKTATSLDGRVATRGGDSRWITGPQAREAGHRIRHAVDALLVGVGTVLADDPSLDVRLSPEALGGARPSHPRPVVLDSHGVLEPGCRLLVEQAHRRPIVVVGDAAAERLRARLGPSGADILVLPSNPGDRRVTVTALLNALGAHGIQSLLVEGGPTVLGAFLDARLVDEIVAFVAPLVIGGTGAPASVGGLGVDALAVAHRLDAPSFVPVGEDMMVRGFVRRPEATVLAPRFASMSSGEVPVRAAEAIDDPAGTPPPPRTSACLRHGTEAA